MKSFLLFFLCATAASADLQNFAASSRIFTGDVYKEVLVDNNDNILVSPFSVETVLALTQSGAVGITGEEIRSSLYLPETKEETEAIIKSVLPSFKNDQYILNTANKIYVEQDFAIKEDFQKTAAEVYQASIENLEFADSVEASEEINHWIEEQTNDKIHDVVKPTDIDASTKVVLVNALYFQGNWSVPFDYLQTKKAAFYSTNDRVVETDTMFIGSEVFNFYESEELDAKFLELPFDGKDAVMTFVLPNKKEGISVLEKQTADVLATPQYERKFVRVLLPKFKIEATIDFMEILKRLGVHAAFDPEKADFSGIAGLPGEFVITKIKQKTFVDVNEGGVEAAAATTTIISPPSVKPTYEQVFVADHPFIFYIQVNGIVLFEGKVLMPSY